MTGILLRQTSRLAWILSLVYGLPASSCAKRVPTPTQAMLVLSATPEAAQRIAFVVVRVSARDRGASEYEPIDAPRIEATEESWPLEVSLLAKDGQASREFFVTAEAYAEDDTLLTVVRVAGTYRAGTRIDIPIAFDTACVEGMVLCPTERSCQEGGCVVVVDGTTDGSEEGPDGGLALTMGGGEPGLPAVGGSGTSLEGGPPQSDPSQDAGATPIVTEPPLDACAEDNGGCTEDQACRVVAMKAVCAECPESALADDNRCGPPLRSITPSEGALTPAFTSTETSYTLQVPLGVSLLSLTLTTDQDVTITVDKGEGPSQVTGGVPFQIGPLPYGDTRFNIALAPTDAGERNPVGRSYALVIQRTRDAKAYLKGVAPGTNDWFGRAVAMSGDYLAAGAFYDDGPTDAQPDCGAVEVYHRTPEGDYLSMTTLRARQPEPYLQFGGALAMDGETLLVGAPATGIISTASGIPLPGREFSGRTYVFERQGDTWSQQQILLSEVVGTGDWYGVALAVDGNTAIVGASEAGAVEVYRRTNDSWARSQRLVGQAESRFGAAVALSGSTLLVGAPTQSSGRVFVYTRADPEADFQRQAELAPTGGSDVANFGTAVGVHSERLIAIGAPGETFGLNFRGADGVFLFDRGASASDWTPRPMLRSGATGTTGFGVSLALVNEATLAVGAPNAPASGQVFADEAPASGGEVGGVYLYVDHGEGFTLDTYLNAENAGRGDWFGYGLASDRGRLAASAMREDSASRSIDKESDDNSCPDCGALYVFE